MIRVGLAAIGLVTVTGTWHPSTATGHQSPAMKTLDEIKQRREKDVRYRSEGLRQVYLTSKDRRERALASLALGVRSLREDPRASFQYLTSAGTILEGDKDLGLIVDFYRAQSLYEDRSYRASADLLSRLLKSRLRSSWQEETYRLLLKSQYHLKEYRKQADTYTRLKRKFSRSNDDEETLQYMAVAYRQLNRTRDFHEALEDLSVNYPLTERSRWAFRELFDLSCSDPKVTKHHYYFAKRLLIKLSRNAHIDTGLREFLKAAADSKMRLRARRVAALTPQEKIDYLRRTRFYGDALDLAQDLYQRAEGKKERAQLTYQLGEIHSSLGETMKAARFFSKYVEGFPLESRVFRARQRLADSLARLKNHQTAAKEYGQLAARSGRHLLRWSHFWNTYVAETTMGRCDFCGVEDTFPVVTGASRLAPTTGERESMKS